MVSERTVKRHSNMTLNRYFNNFQEEINERLVLGHKVKTKNDYLCS